MSEIEPAELAQEIERAFAEARHPGVDRLVEYTDYWESPEVVQSFGDTHWKSVPLDTLVNQRLSLPLFTPEAFRFYLPAFLRASLLYPSAVDTLTENIFYMLTPPPASAGPEREQFLRRLSGLDAQQKAVLGKFIQLYNQTETSYPDSQRERAAKFWEEYAQADEA
jgi:Family of unknown function (DUF6714)